MNFVLSSTRVYTRTDIDVQRDIEFDWRELGLFFFSVADGVREGSTIQRAMGPFAEGVHLLRCDRP